MPTLRKLNIPVSMSKDKALPSPVLSDAPLPRILILFSRFERIDSIGQWLRQAGYPVSSHPLDFNEDTDPAFPLTDVLLFQTSSPARDLPPVIDVVHHRYKKRHPVFIVLTNRESLGGMDVTSGIDDFLCAPYDPHELEERIRFAMWRRHGVQMQDMIVLGDLAINLGNYEVTIRGEPIDLTLKEYELLKHLATHRGRVFTRDHLLNTVWGYNYFGGTRTVDVHVRRLRMKIERHGVKIITTVRGVGYKFGE